MWKSCIFLFNFAFAIRYISINNQQYDNNETI